MTMMTTTTMMTIPPRCNSIRPIFLILALTFGSWAAGAEDEAPQPVALRTLLSDLDLLAAKKLVHARRRLYQSVRARCESTTSSQTKLPADDAGTCAVIFAESSQRQPALEQRIAALLEQTAASNEQSLYYRGRVAIARPLPERAEVIRGLVDWTALEKLMPESGEIAYWKAQTLLVAGEYRRADDSFAQSEALNTPLAVERRRAHPDLREEVDGLSWGFSPWISINPAQGLSGGITIHDDRLSDRNQKVRFDASASTRGSWAAHGFFENRDWFRAATNTELGLSLDAKVGQWVEDYFGRGVDAPQAGSTELEVDRGDGELTLFTAWKRSLELHIGWGMRAARIRKHPELDVLTAQGPIGKLIWDNRDSRALPRRGMRLSVQGFFPTVALGSQRSFERWDIAMEGYIPFSRSHVTSLSAVAELGSRRTPFNEFARVSGTLNVPGLRANRYRDTSSVAAFLEHRWHVGESNAISGFISTLSLAPSLEVRDFKRFKFGGGMAWSHRNQRLVSALSRVEVGIFDGEFVLQGGLGLAL